MSSSSHNDKVSTSSEAQLSSASSYLSYPVSHVVSGLYRRFTETSPASKPHQTSQQQQQQQHQYNNPSSSSTLSGVYTPPRRTASPFQPPPLSPLSLIGFDSSTFPSAQILSRALAEEIRLLIPPRLQLADTWSLAYSLEEDGVSLATLYNRCASLPIYSSFVLVIRDAAGGIFGAYLTSPPHPSPTFYGTGECFLWRASLIPSTSLLSISLPPPPSAPTTASLPRSTTLANPRSPSSPPTQSPSTTKPPIPPPLPTTTTTTPARATSPSGTGTGTSTPSDRIRFKAFPYSGVNDYLIFCEPSFLSVGGGDGHYGLWLDAVLERGVSSACPTFGNEPLSEEGEKFEVVGVEVWCVGGGGS